MQYIISPRASAERISDDEYNLFNGANIKHPVNQLIIDVISLFSEPKTIDEVITLCQGEESIRPILELMVEQLFLIPTDTNDQEEMRKTWNCLAATSAEDAAYFIDNEVNTLEEFDNSGKEAVTALNEWLTIGSQDKVANIGCGMGRIERHLAPMISELWSFDVSDSMLERAKEHLNGINNIHLIRTEGKLEALAPASLDKVISFLVFQHIPKQATWQYFEEAARTLKSGGEFAFQILCYNDEDGYDPSEHSPLDRYYGAGKARYKSDEVKTQLTEAGFEIREFRPGLYEGHERRLSGTSSKHWQSHLVIAVKH